MSGAFLLFGPTENSWAVGNSSWRAWYVSPLFNSKPWKSNISQAKNYQEAMPLISKTIRLRDIRSSGLLLRGMDCIILAYLVMMVVCEGRKFMRKEFKC